MREILFRGQTRKNGEKVRMCDGQKSPGHWVYGGVVQGVGSHSIIYGGKNVNDPDENLEKWCVHTDTLGQFTGLTDKNGEKIFEGDILLFGTRKLVVWWNGEAFQWQAKERQTYPCITFDGKPTIDVVWDNIDLGWIAAEVPCIGKMTTRIIGNIHDNPELLENP